MRDLTPVLPEAGGGEEHLPHRGEDAGGEGARAGAHANPSADREDCEAHLPRAQPAQVRARA